MPYWVPGTMFCCLCPLCAQSAVERWDLYWESNNEQFGYNLMLFGKQIHSQKVVQNEFQS
jgi:hypothetical protein